jgi:hypothetical protein
MQDVNIRGSWVKGRQQFCIILQLLYTLIYLFIYVFTWQYWDLHSGPHACSTESTAWITLPALFGLGIFQIGPCKLFAQGWLGTTILLISASWLARITGVSHWCQTTYKEWRRMEGDIVWAPGWIRMEAKFWLFLDKSTNKFTYLTIY